MHELEHDLDALNQLLQSIADRVVMPQQWSTFFKYANLVRTVGQLSYARLVNLIPGLHKDALATLCSLRPTLSLLPNVRSLSWAPLRLPPAVLPHLLSLLGNHVATIKIANIEASNQAEAYLRSAFAVVGTRFPHLRTLCVSFAGQSRYRTSVATSDALSSLVPVLQRLVKFDCGNIAINKSAVLHLARLPSLRKLAMRFDDRTSWSRPHGIQQAFPRLEILTVVSTVECYMAFSRAFKLAHVGGLELKTLRSPDPPPFRDLFSAIRRQFAIRTFRVLSVSPFEADPNGDDQAALDSPIVVRPDDFAPLLAFTNMTKFTFAAECRHALDDALLLSMTEAWRSLVHISLSPDSYCAHDTLPTFSALVHLALHGRQLRSIRLAVDVETSLDDDWDFSVCDEPPEMVFGQLANRSSLSEVETLFVGSSPISARCHLVALMLARVFPQLTSIEYSEEVRSPAHRKYVGRWREVGKYIPLFGSLRADERRRMEHTAPQT